MRAFKATILRLVVLLVLIPLAPAQDRTPTGRILPPPQSRVPASKAVDSVNLYEHSILENASRNF